MNIGGMSKARPKHHKPKGKGHRDVLTWRGAAWLEGCYWAGFFLALKSWVCPELHYQNAAAEVFSSFPFQASFLGRPGGGMAWLNALLLQGCQVPWLGALLGTILAALACQALRCLLRLAHGHWPKAAHLVLGAPIFLVFSQLERSACLLVLGFTLALGLAAGAGWWSRQGVIGRWLAPWLGVAMLYQVAGPATLVFMLVAVVVTEVRPHTPPSLRSLLNWAAAGGVCLAWHVWQTGLPVSRVWEVWETPFMKILAAGLAGWMVGVGLVVRLTASAPASAGQGQPWPAGRQRLLWGGGMVAGGLAVLGLFDTVKHQYLRLEYLALRERWPECLELARAQSRFTMAGWVYLLRGLYHRGELPESLFTYAVVKQDELLPGATYGPQALVATSMAMLELGQVNHAERLACEAVEILGERPELLWVLARVHVLKNQPVAAGNYLRVWQRQPFQSRRAGQWLAQLAEDPRLERNPEMAALRAVMVTTDYPSPGLVTAPLLQQLLHTNPTNRMALEFLLTHYLVSGQLKKFTEYLGQVGAAGYARLPRHFEEAAWLAQRVHQLALPSELGMAIREETRQRYRRFEEIVRSHDNNLQAAQRALVEEFGDTYWFYYWYEQTGASMRPVSKMRP